MDSRRWDEVAEAVRAEDFYTRAHREIFAAIHALHASSCAVDVVTTSEWLKNNGTLSLPVDSLISGIGEPDARDNQFKAYAQIVRERSILRSLIAAASDISEKAYQPEGLDIDALLDHAEKAVFEISDADRRGSFGFKAIQGLLSRR